MIQSLRVIPHSWTRIHWRNWSLPGCSHKLRDFLQKIFAPLSISLWCFLFYQRMCTLFQKMQYRVCFLGHRSCCIWGTENTHAYIENPTHLAMSKERPLQSMAIVIGPCWTNFSSQKLKRRILATFGFNRTPLHATQPKLHSMFCALFFKITLSAAELMSFGHLRAAIWHFWTIICGVRVKDKCYADKPETIDALKDNIRDGIGEIQLHTIDNVLKKWTKMSK